MSAPGRSEYRSAGHEGNSTNGDDALCADGTAETEITMRTLSLSVLMLFVAGCATQAERAARVQHEVDDMMGVYGPGCETLGYRRDSDPWRDCVLRLATKDSFERREFTTTNCITNRGFVSCTTF